MAVVTVTKCDSPACENHDTPECEKPYRPPYGWLTMKGGLFGCGPNIKVEVCSTACLEAAVDNAIAEAEDR
jgi:hypothetical protein